MCFIVVFFPDLEVPARENNANFKSSGQCVCSSSTLFIVNRNT